MKRFLLGLVAHACTVVVTLGISYWAMTNGALDVCLHSLELQPFDGRCATFNTLSGLSFESPTGAVNIGMLDLKRPNMPPRIWCLDSQGHWQDALQPPGPVMKEASVNRRNYRLAVAE